MTFHHREENTEENKTGKQEGRKTGKEKVRVFLCSFH